MKTLGIALLSCFLLHTSAWAQSSLGTNPPAVTQALSVNKFDGGRMGIFIGHNVEALNADSKLKREWYQIQDPSSPVWFAKPSGIEMFFGRPLGTLNDALYYRIDTVYASEEPISAVEFKVVLMDVFGSFVTTLSHLRVDDFAAERQVNGLWRALDETDARRTFSSVMYIAKVRTASGKIYEVDETAVAEQIKKIFKRVQLSDLAPSPNTRRQ